MGPATSSRSRTATAATTSSRAGSPSRWTKGGEKQIASIKRAREVREIADLDHAKEVKSQLEALSVKLPVRAGEAGRLFGSVTVADIVAAVSRAGGPADRQAADRARRADQDGRCAPSNREAAPRGLGNLALDVVAA